MFKMIKKLKAIIFANVSRELVFILFMLLIVFVLIKLFGSHLPQLIPGDNIEEETQSIIIFNFTVVLFMITWRYIDVGKQERKKETLIHYVWFRRAFDIPLIASVGTIGLIVISTYSNGLPNLCFTKECLKSTYDLYEAPILIMAAGLALSGITAAIHRSEQTYLQIEKTEEKNLFDNYIKHQEFFFNTFENLPEYIGRTDWFTITNKHAVYKIFYPENNFTTLNLEIPSNKLVLEIKSELEKITTFCTVNSTSDSFTEAISGYKKLLSMLHIEYKENISFAVFINDNFYQFIKLPFHKSRLSLEREQLEKQRTETLSMYPVAQVIVVGFSTITQIVNKLFETTGVINAKDNIPPYDVLDITQFNSDNIYRKTFRVLQNQEFKFDYISPQK